MSNDLVAWRKADEIFGSFCASAIFCFEASGQISSRPYTTKNPLNGGLVREILYFRKKPRLLKYYNLARKDLQKNDPIFVIFEDEHLNKIYALVQTVLECETVEGEWQRCVTKFTKRCVDASRNRRTTLDVLWNWS